MNFASDAVFVYVLVPRGQLGTLAVCAVSDQQGAGGSLQEKRGDVSLVL